jgi:succinyl-CoA synthetase alpha subunit
MWMRADQSADRRQRGRSAVDGPPEALYSLAMSILIDAKTRVICQGITGSAGAFHTKGCLDYGTRMVGGVTPGKGGQTDTNGLPIFDTVSDAVAGAQADATMIFVPPPFAADAILEAAAAGIRVVCAVTEGIPTQDMIRVKAVLREYPGCHLIGPNCPGVITPGRRASGEGPSATFKDGCKIGIMPGYIHLAKADAATTERGIGQTTCVGIGGDPVKGLNFIELLEMFEKDAETDGVVMIGEIGGSDETEAGYWIKQHVSKPVVAFIAGRTAPPGKRMGHAGAIIGGADDTAQAKMDALRGCGVHVAESPADIGALMAQVLNVELATSR